MGRIGIPATAITALAVAAAGCGGDETVGASEMPAALRPAIPRLEQAGYEVRAKLVGSREVPVLVVNPDADGAARIAISSPQDSRLPLSIDGVPAKRDNGTAGLTEVYCGRFAAGAPVGADAQAALDDSGLCR